MTSLADFTPAEIESIEARVDKSGEHWRWTGRHGDERRGRVDRRRKGWLVHRLLYAWHVEPLVDYVELQVTCGVSWCINPSHARLADNRRNVSADELAEWEATGETCPSGHPRSIHGRRTPKGFVYCAECNRNNHR